MNRKHRPGVTAILTLAALALFIMSAAAFAAPAAVRRGSAGSAQSSRGRVIATKVYGGQFPVYYRAALPITAAQARYPGYHPERTLLRAGTVRMPDAPPLVCDIILERDTAIKLRDGTVIYADVFRPADETRCPALLCISLGGKEIGSQHLDDFPDRLGVSKDATSGLECFEGLDPAYWVSQGYAVVNVDPRGAYSSRGNMNSFGRQYAEDGYDIIEWLAVQPWCNGRVGMGGALGLATSQWYIAAEQPPHLEAIAPWGGFSDYYREISCRGGIPSPELAGQIAESLASKSGLIEDQSQMITRYPFMNAYWADKAVNLEEITVPAYAAIAFANEMNSTGTLEGFRRIASREKWLRIHTSRTLRDFYDPQNVADLADFFDYYLKDVNNGWQRRPRVRVSVSDPRRMNIVNRAENEFPIARTQETCLYLDMSARSLSWTKPRGGNAASYDSETEESAVQFTYRFDKDIELTGFMSLHLWAAAAESDDLDIAVRVEKLDRRGRPMGGDDGAIVATGRVRASCRALDENRSTPIHPILSGLGEQKLTPGVPVALDIGISPVGMMYHAGESLRLTVMPCRPDETRIPVGSVKIIIPRDVFTYDPSETVPMVGLGGQTPAQPARGTSNAGSSRQASDARPASASRNKGAHILYGGGEYDSYILLPVVPPKN